MPRRVAGGPTAHSIWVIDAAGVLQPEDAARLNARLVAVEQRTRHQVAVVTVKSLGGRDILDYSVTLARYLGVGRAGEDDGVMLLVAPSEHKVRIEVGYGLEASLKDEEAAEILNKDVLPRFKQGDMTAGILAGSEAIIREISR